MKVVIDTGQSYPYLLLYGHFGGEQVMVMDHNRRFIIMHFHF